MKDLVPWGKDWAPLRELRREMNRVFDTVWHDAQDKWTQATGWSPLVDIKETKNNYEVHAELPGMSKEAIAITMSGNTLTLSGERKREEAQEDENYHRLERYYGTFTRSFSFPSEVDAEGIDAVFENGVLCIAIPKKVADKPRPIEIKVK